MLQHIFFQSHPKGRIGHDPTTQRNRRQQAQPQGTKHKGLYRPGVIFCLRADKITIDPDVPRN
jgi:hypothetical protein